MVGVQSIGEPTVEPLIKSLKDKDRRVRQMTLVAITKAYLSFICRGVPGTEPILIKALNKHGDKSMGEAFLNCGNIKLEKAAHRWAFFNGFTIIQNYRTGFPRWGSHR